jgi:hypothetical protein
MKHVKGIEYDGVGWLMTSSGCGWMEFIALTRATDCLKKTKWEKGRGQAEGIQAIISLRFQLSSWSLPASSLVSCV